MPRVRVGSSEYEPGQAHWKSVATAVMPYVLADEQDRAILVHQGNGQTFWVTYRDRRAADARAIALRAAGLPVEVKRQGVD